MGSSTSTPVEDCNFAPWNITAENATVYDCGTCRPAEVPSVPWWYMAVGALCLVVFAVLGIAATLGHILGRYPRRTRRRYLACVRVLVNVWTLVPKVINLAYLSDPATQICGAAERAPEICGRTLNEFMTHTTDEKGDVMNARQGLAAVIAQFVLLAVLAEIARDRLLDGSTSRLVRYLDAAKLDPEDVSRWRLKLDVALATMFTALAPVFLAYGFAMLSSIEIASDCVYYVEFLQYDAVARSTILFFLLACLALCVDGVHAAYQRVQARKLGEPWEPSMMATRVFVVVSSLLDLIIVTGIIGVTLALGTDGVVLSIVVSTLSPAGASCALFLLSHVADVAASRTERGKPPPLLQPASSISAAQDRVDFDLPLALAELVPPLVTLADDITDYEARELPAAGTRNANEDETSECGSDRQRLTITVAVSDSTGPKSVDETFAARVPGSPGASAQVPGDNAVAPGIRDSDDSSSPREPQLIAPVSPPTLIAERTASPDECVQDEASVKKPHESDQDEASVEELLRRMEAAGILVLFDREVDALPVRWPRLEQMLTACSAFAEAIDGAGRGVDRNGLTFDERLALACYTWRSERAAIDGVTFARIIDRILALTRTPQQWHGAWIPRYRPLVLPFLRVLARAARKLPRPSAEELAGVRLMRGVEHAMAVESTMAVFDAAASHHPLRMAAPGGASSPTGASAAATSFRTAASQSQLLPPPPPAGTPLLSDEGEPMHMETPNLVSFSCPVLLTSDPLVALGLGRSAVPAETSASDLLRKWQRSLMHVVAPGPAIAPLGRYSARPPMKHEQRGADGHSCDWLLLPDDTLSVTHGIHRAAHVAADGPAVPTWTVAMVDTSSSHFSAGGDGQAPAATAALLSPLQPSTPFPIPGVFCHRLSIEARLRELRRSRARGQQVQHQQQPPAQTSH